jgi:hypothetical protein
MWPVSFDGGCIRPYVPLCAGLDSQVSEPRVGGRPANMPCSKGRERKMRRLLAIVVPLVLILASCSTSSEPTATYTGGACAYGGPSEFDLGESVTFTFINESDTTDLGFSVWAVPEGATADEILEVGIYDAVGHFGGAIMPEPGFYASLWPPTAVDTSVDLAVTLDTSGQHALICFDSSGDYAIMFTVSDS